MIAQIRIQGLGPHDDTTLTLDPRGLTVISGPSQSGKSTIIEAILFCLFGLDASGKPMQPEAVRDGHKRIDVTIRTAKGGEIRRTMTRSRSFRRYFGDDSHDTEASFRSAHRLAREITADGRPELAARLVLVPMSWVEHSTQHARGLRDILCGDCDLAGEIERILGSAPETTEIKRAERSRRDARRDADQAGGAMVQARSAFDAIGEAPSVGDTTGARAVLELAASWKRHDTSAGVLASWETRRDELGKRPKGDEKAKTAAAKILSSCSTDYGAVGGEVNLAAWSLSAAEATRPDDHVDAEAEAERVLRDADAAHIKATAAAGSDVCPTCERDGWDGPAEHLKQAETALDEASTALDEAAEYAGKLRAERKAERNEQIEVKRKACEQAKAKLGKAKAALDKATAFSDAATAACAALTAWTTASAALGNEPPTSTPPNDAPPSDEDTRQADAAIDDARRADGAASAHARQLREAQAQADATQARAETATRAAKQSDRLVEAIREAPSALLRRGLEQLGELGPVTLRVSDDGPAVEVLIDGRDWRLASTGRQIVADQWLRAGIRRAMGMRYLPLFVDRTQDWSGGWPKADGPVVRLVTAPGEGLTAAIVPKREAT